MNAAWNLELLYLIMIWLYIKSIAWPIVSSLIYWNQSGKNSISGISQIIEYAGFNIYHGDMLQFVHNFLTLHTLFYVPHQCSEIILNERSSLICKLTGWVNSVKQCICAKILKSLNASVTPHSQCSMCNFIIYIAGHVVSHA